MSLQGHKLTSPEPTSLGVHKSMSPRAHGPTNPQAYEHLNPQAHEPTSPQAHSLEATAGAGDEAGLH